MASGIWMIQNMLYNGESRFPNYVDMIYPEKQDNRTAKQILNDIQKALSK